MGLQAKLTARGQSPYRQGMILIWSEQQESKDHRLLNGARAQGKSHSCPVQEAEHKNRHRRMPEVTEMIFCSPNHMQHDQPSGARQCES